MIIVASYYRKLLIVLFFIHAGLTIIIHLSLLYSHSFECNVFNQMVIQRIPVSIKGLKVNEFLQLTHTPYPLQYDDYY